MLKVNADNLNSDLEYINSLVDSISLSKVEIARRIGISEAALRHYRNGTREITYSIQFCLECLSDEFKSKTK